ncbi:xanthine dehydrogenase family protein molybdopterin-binding subunit [Pseudohalocynthiibacter aestuariivivens]|jgi:CO/xanthine dehydrogenase Mo-binding subunit|uniref:Xanthine dehydrogenase family protein molybdopterin-binding subunit n=1 Tax=Pseudohalocynthiibacter aestuariivivens TaxID=1591409 RepID=A0ABV5JCC9_9RHOB|nr:MULTISPECIES: xanthine dehydrogenase family protein molybdopterin-binding subunit [Pseudohalocynthiibacter]MBS9716052.1 xanthine dehydrogenase family protein molybdopterin-binding subunit [Pseudohalocynthiibacter aestuariivivens]MCK0102390.1 xanthine dehydrogenase family protein molybdopterin-binding subunit [Pseudohalocynthiibacter sp. F2068]
MALDTSNKREFKVVGTRVQRPDGIDKVTGKAMYGADVTAPGMLIGRILRSPHAHARIVSLDTSAAEALKGVKAVVTTADLSTPEDDYFADIRDNCLAREKVLYDGHAVAAVAATNKHVAKEALKLIKVEYEILSHVTDVDEAMKADAPIVQEGRADESVHEGWSQNVTSHFEFGHGDLEAGFAKADKIVERTFKTAATHQGYIEPHACLASLGTDGRGELWCCTQGQFLVRTKCAEILGIEASQLRVTASEIGGGFGGKTTVFIEPVALALSRKAGRPVKLVMSREEVFRASGPTVSSSIDVKIGMTKDGRITAGQAKLRYQGGAFPNGTVEFGSQAAFAAYDLEAVQTLGWNVMTNRPKEISYRAPGAPMAIYAVESVVDELCQELSLDPLETRLKNAARKGTLSSYGPTFNDIGLVATLEAAKTHPHYSAPLGKNQGRGLSCGFWFNFGGNTCVSLNLNSDGTVGVVEGNPDIGGSRASISMMAAEELGIPYEKVRTVITDTNSLGYNDVTDGSRVTFAVGLATIEAARAAIKIMCSRVAKIWGIDEEAVVWEDGCAKPSGPNAGEFPPMTIAEIAAIADNTGGPIAGHHEVNADGAGVSFGVHIVDTEVDPETGATKILRYTVFQDAGKAVHPDYVEGQMQGGAVQGIGWALNEEYIYGEDGRLQNPGFLDYRIPVASDLPPIDTVILEIPNPGHPYGVRGVGETSIVPPLAAISNAVSRATGVRMTELPMSPPKLLKAMSER